MPREITVSVELMERETGGARLAAVVCMDEQVHFFRVASAHGQPATEDIAEWPLCAQKMLVKREVLDSDEVCGGCSQVALIWMAGVDAPLPSKGGDA